ncbi:MAG: sigma-70 family RNA polymerase sigma factor [Phycisphaerae bacterium]|nr:sigma-70 family RNA polymerase sigma factor [Phycisphaerae bacterium]
MSPPGQNSDPIRDIGRPFATTHWSIVLAAGDDNQPDSKAALAELCEAYWYPLYSYVRRRGHDADEAQDMAQEFFAVLLAKEHLRAADPNRGRFRSFLLASMNNFLANQRRRQLAQKRGGGQAPLSLDFESAETRFTHEPSHDLTPEKIYERRWAMALLDRALSMLRQEYAAGGKAALFDRLSVFLAGDRGPAYCEIAAELDMTEGAVKVAIHRLRTRCREHLRCEVAQTVADPGDVADELRDLLAVVRS